MGFLAYGLSLIVGGLAFYFYTKSALSIGCLLGFALFGLVQVVVAVVRFYRSINLYKLALDSAKSDMLYLKNKEYPWVKEIISRIEKMRYVETWFFGSSLVLVSIAVIFNLSPLIIGTMAGMCINAAVLLAFDLFTQSRLIEYQRQIEKLG